MNYFSTLSSIYSHMHSHILDNQVIYHHLCPHPFCFWYDLIISINTLPCIFLFFVTHAHTILVHCCTWPNELKKYTAWNYMHQNFSLLIREQNNDPLEMPQWGPIQMHRMCTWTTKRSKGWEQMAIKERLRPP